MLSLPPHVTELDVIGNVPDRTNSIAAQRQRIAMTQPRRPDLCVSRVSVVRCRSACSTTASAMTTQSYQVPYGVLYYFMVDTKLGISLQYLYLIEYGIRHTSIYYGVQYTGIPGTIDPAVTLYSTNSFHGT